MLIAWKKSPRAVGKRCIRSAHALAALRSSRATGFTTAPSQPAAAPSSPDSRRYASSVSASDEKSSVAVRHAAGSSAPNRRAFWHHCTRPPP